GFGHQVFHDLTDVLDIETSTVESAIAGDGGQHLTDRLYAPFTGGVRTLHYQSGCAHSDNHAVPPSVEWNGRICNHFVGSSGSAGEESSTHPIDQMVRGDVIRRDDNHAVAPPGANPVLRQRYRLCGARARRVDLGVGTTRADEFSELRMSHGQNPQQEAAVEDVRFLVDGGVQFVNVPVDLLHQD